jgi:hypothetical protein
VTVAATVRVRRSMIQTVPLAANVVRGSAGDHRKAPIRRHSRALGPGGTNDTVRVRRSRERNARYLGARLLRERHRQVDDRDIVRAKVRHDDEFSIGREGRDERARLDVRIAGTHQHARHLRPLASGRPPDSRR